LKSQKTKGGEKSLKKRTRTPAHERIANMEIIGEKQPSKERLETYIYDTE
jgi:hypothetical protein